MPELEKGWHENMPKENQLHEPTEAAKCADVQEYLKGTLQVCERALGD